MSDLPSLLDDSVAPAAASTPAVSRWSMLEIGRGARAWFDHPKNGPRRQRWTRRIGAGLGVIAIAAGIYAAIPRSQPDYSDDPLDELFDYTLLTDDFNNLSVEERMKLIGQLVQRLKGMSSEDSVLLAAFAGGIAGKAREQLMENASLLAIDVWDQYAKEYHHVPEEEREQYLEKTFVEFTRLMESVAGQTSDKTDEERIAEVKEQAKREKDRMTSVNGPKPPGAALGMVFNVMNGDVGGHASPQQRQRGGQMLRDMMRHFRGQDTSTGKPLGPG
jgi:hypothetical protein